MEFVRVEGPAPQVIKDMAKEIINDLIAKERKMEEIQVILDTETTGFSHHRNAIIEIGAVALMPGGGQLTYQSYCNPGEKYLGEEADGALEVNHITRETIRAAPTSEQVAESFRSWLSMLSNFAMVKGKIPGYRLFAFNAPFDGRFLKVAPWNIPYDDVLWGDDIMLTVAQEYGRTKIKLEVALQRFGIERIGGDDKAHTALFDALSTAELFKQLGVDDE